MGDPDLRSHYSLCRQFIACMRRVPLLRQPGCPQPCIQPAGACRGTVWALTRSQATMEFPAWRHTTSRCMQRKSMRSLEQCIVTCLLATSQFRSWWNKTSRCMQRESVLPQDAHSPKTYQQVNAKERLKWYTTMCCYPSLCRQRVNSMAIHNRQV